MNLDISNYYVQQQIYSSNNTLVFRALRKSDNQAVILKFLKEDYPSPEKLTRYRQGYEISRLLMDIEGVVKVYNLEKYQNTLMLCLEDFGGQSLKIWQAKCTFSLVELLKYAIQISDILGQIHAHNIVHKDINPANLLLNRDTGQLKIIDFGISTQLSKQHLSLQNPEILEGTLAYMSPEQTGRMNRPLDYRTDLYSLGVTFYELFTGSLPFHAADAIALVHSHIAIQPIPPVQIKPDLPGVISDIILKLLEKTADARYQSAWGVKADLELCLQQWQENQRIEPFVLAQQDLTARFQIPQKLYGREAEINTLLTTFERVAVGKAEMMLIAGYSGIGKSVLVKEIFRSLTEKQGYWVAGKFDQFQRNIPYSALVNAFGELMQQLLTENQANLEGWKDKLLSALGSNGQVIIDVVPELELIIGAQPAVPQLDPSESQNRFNMVFQNFMRVFCQFEHPLVLFLDDLQWADSATLKLLELVMTDQENVALLLIGAYRDNEVNPTHPLMTTVKQLRDNNVLINQIILKPLTFEHINQLIADSLHQPATKVQTLTELVMRKTAGNPFFVNQFLWTLYDEGFLHFVTATADQKPHWQWDTAQIATLNITDNVVDLMVHKLKKLPTTSQQALRLAACIGNQFEVGTLAMIHEKTPVDIFQDLMPALSEGFILPASPLELEGLEEGEIQSSTLAIRHFYFLHDRVQQAAYALIAAEQKQVVHLQIGRLLLENTTDEKLDDVIFDIVGHFSHSLELVTTQAERLHIAQLCLLAGEKAKNATAYEGAINYLTMGQRCLPADCWEQHYDLTLKLFNEAVEVAYLNGDFVQMRQWAQIISQQARCLVDEAKANEIQIFAYAGQGQYHEAIKQALFYLEKLGFPFPENPTPEEIKSALQNVQKKLANQPILSLINLPLMKELHILVIRMILAVFAATFHVNPNLMILLFAKQADLSLQYGNVSESCFAYVCYGFVLCAIEGQIEAGYQFGQLALTLLKKLGEKRLEARIIHTFNTFVRFWKEHINTSLQALSNNYQLGLETGDVEFAAYSVHMYSYYCYLSGKPLATIDQEMAVHNRAAVRLKQEGAFARNYLHWQIVVNLMKPISNPYEICGEIYDEKVQLSQHEDNHDRTAIYNFYFNKTILYYWFENPTAALKYNELSAPYIDGVVGLLQLAIASFYDSLIRLALYPTLSKVEQAAVLDKVADNQAKLHMWAQHAPMNFQHKYDLVEAEKARIFGKLEAISWYEKAIKGANINEYLHEEALAYELAAKFYLAQGMEKFAQTYFKEAYYAYQRWGAVAKTKHLETHYATFLKTHTPSNNSLDTLSISRATTSSSTDSNQWLDLNSIMKAAQTLSGEIVLSRLLDKMMRIVIENAGAEKGFLLLLKEEQWFIEAEGRVDRTNVEVLQAMPIQANLLPVALVDYVARTRESLVLNNAYRDGLLVRDNYIKQQKTKSVLGLPLMNQEQLVGILYLENNLAEGVFTADRLETLNLLSVQIAISIQNAKLYAEIQEKERTLAQFLEAVPVGIGILNRAGRLHFINQTGQQWLRQGIVNDSNAQSLNQTYQLYFADSEQLYPNEKLPIVRALRGERSRIDDLEVRDGERTIPLEAWGTPIYDEQGNILYAITTFLDISERRQAEANKIRLVQEQEAKNAALRYNAEIEAKNTELAITLNQLQQTQNQLVESEKMAALGNLVAGVAHEINTPVGVGVTAATQLDSLTLDFVKRYKEGKMARSDLEQYLNAVHQTSGLILKNLTRAAELTKSFKSVAVDQASEEQRTIMLHDYLHEILTSLKPKLKNTPYHISVDCDPNLQLTTYPGAFSQIITNLVMNSLRHGFAGREQGNIHITAQPEGERVQLRYSDDGKGIAPDVINKIFEPFFTTDRAGGGSGLGMHIVYNLVTHKLNGSIHCESKLGNGTWFTINIPLSLTT